VKLLFDENISYKICKKIEDVFPESKHLSDLRLEQSSDIQIWEFAKSNNFTIVIFDADFIDISLLKGFPPKIIWLKIGNTTTENLAKQLRDNFILIKHFLEQDDLSFLEIK
jgi:predicted nuclease of predicted toxin-antitoxin system